MVDLVGVDRDFILDARHPWRHILADTVQMNLDAAVLKPNHRRDALDALDHAGRKCGQQKPRGIEGVGTACEIRIEYDFNPFTPGDAPVSGHPVTIYEVLQVFLSWHDSGSYLRMGVLSISRL
jgi:hypothetical protein